MDRSYPLRAAYRARNSARRTDRAGGPVRSRQRRAWDAVAMAHDDGVEAIERDAR